MKLPPEVNIELLVRREARKHGVDEEMALEVMNCESGGNPEAVGDSGNSYGLWQIHLPAHPSITKEIALNPASSTLWAMPRLRDNPEIWTCWRLGGR